MEIFMAGGTRGIRKMKLTVGAVRFYMALNTGSRIVRSCERKYFVVLGKSIRRRREALFRMAFRAIVFVHLCKLAFMSIGMTIGTFRKRQLQHLSGRFFRLRFMALFALHHGMPSDKFERRFVMIKFR
jgi:hypothetical protein